MTAVTTTRSPRRVGTRRPRTGSLAGPFVRHLLVLVLTAAAVFLLAGQAPVAQQFSAWLGAAVAIGVVAALLGRRLLGVLVLVAGIGIAILLHLHLRLGSGNAAMDELTAHGSAYAIAAALAVVVYLGTWLMLRYVTRSREAG